MGFYRFNHTGCCSCGGCISDADYTCICTCTNRFPRSLYLADGNGVHELRSAPGTVRWTAALLQPDTDVWSLNPFTRVCSHMTTGLRYGYNLEFLCPPGNVAHPTGYWSLGIGFGSIGCNGEQYSNDSHTQAIPNALVDIVDGFHCDIASGLAFNLPTTVRSMEVPGGGGSFLVVV